MSSHRQLIASVALLALLLLAFPLLVSIFADLEGTSPVESQTQAAASPPRIEAPTASSTATSTVTPSLTPTSTATPTLTPSLTPSPTPTPSLTPTSTATPTPTPLPRVYLFPFVQVFSMGQPQPSSSTQVLMYDGGTDVFEVLATQGTFTRAQTLDGSLTFWTASTNASPVQPPAAIYDYSFRGRTAKLSQSSVFACAYNESPTVAFGACKQLNNSSTVVLVAHLIAGTNPLYIARINGAAYVISETAVASVQ
jgi:hypothetical protein